MLKANILALVLTVLPLRGEMAIEGPVSLRVPVIVGKVSTPTPAGTYELRRAYSTKLKSNMLIFKEDSRYIWSIHPNLASRTKQLYSPSVQDNWLSGGCIGVDLKTFNVLWNLKEPIVLHVY